MKRKIKYNFNLIIINPKHLVLGIGWETRMPQEDLEMSYKDKAQYRIIKLGDLTSFIISKVEGMLVGNCLKRLRHVVLTAITRGKFRIVTQIQITLLKEWPKVKLEQILNTQKLNNRINMKTLTDLKLIRHLLHHLKKLQFWKHMIRDLLDQNCIKVFQEKEKKLMLIQYLACLQVWVVNNNKVRTDLFPKPVNLVVKNHSDQVAINAYLDLLKQITNSELLNHVKTFRIWKMQILTNSYQMPWTTTPEAKPKIKCLTSFKMLILWKTSKEWSRAKHNPTFKVPRWVGVLLIIKRVRKTIC